MLQSLVAPLVGAAECERPDGTASCTYVPDQGCTGRLATAVSSLNSSSNGTAAVQPQSSLVQRAHQRNLVVHAYTFRNEVSLSLIFDKPVLWHPLGDMAAF